MAERRTTGEKKKEQNSEVKEGEKNEENEKEKEEEKDCEGREMRRKPRGVLPTPLYREVHVSNLLLTSNIESQFLNT